MELTFRTAEKSDVPLIYTFIYALAEYHGMCGELTVTEDRLAHWLFEQQRAHVFFLVLDEVEIGAVLYFYNYSTVTGRGGVYLEDLYIRPEYRGHGYGKAALQELARIALQNGCARMDWMCLDWNTSSIAFYQSIGAEPMNGWTAFHIEGDALSHLANAPLE